MNSAYLLKGLKIVQDNLALVCTILYLYIIWSSLIWPCSIFNTDVVSVSVFPSVSLCPFSSLLPLPPLLSPPLSPPWNFNSQVMIFVCSSGSSFFKKKNCPVTSLIDNSFLMGVSTSRWTITGKATASYTTPAVTAGNFVGMTGDRIENRNEVAGKKPGWNAGFGVYLYTPIYMITILKVDCGMLNPQHGRSTWKGD